MATMKEQLNAALKEAMKSKDNERRDAIRLLTSAVKQVEVDTRADLTDEQVMDVLQKEAKKRRESITELEGAGRDEAAAKEAFELTVIEEFLPKQMSEDELRVIVADAIEQTGAASPKEMGKVMGVVMPKVKGRADGGMVNKIARDLLNKQ